MSVCLAPASDDVNYTTFVAMQFPGIVILPQLATFSGVWYNIVDWQEIRSWDKSLET